ncbi:MAG: efflux RND transporter periplasmic adaptor subunit [Akkermansiaceae bacterium]|jgi:multidrug efflux pump subunit AcrA (membrane-fusion protein)|nr:efflux RND transporter periplasmic adaptor subunit [Akkermansiaceae bacterium]
MKKLFNSNYLQAALLLTYTTCSVISAEKSDRAANTVILTEAGVQNLRLKTIEVEERDFETTVFAVGKVEEIPSHQYSVSSRISGRAITVNAFVGDLVTEGQVLAIVESRQPGNPPPKIEMKAPHSGLIVKTHILRGKPVEPNQDLFDISDRSKMWISAMIPEQLAAGIGPGTEARISFPALKNEPIIAKLLRFGVTADKDAGTLRGIFEIDNTDRKLLPGMRAECNIIVSKRPSVYAIPEEALQGDPANRVVYVKDFDLENAFVRSPVVIGQKSGGWVEVTNGLFPGDEVVTRGSYSLGFVGGGGGMSLKEALDAAHGHEHAEDGSELTEADKKGAEAEDGHDHASEGGGAPKWLIYYSIGVSLVALLLVQQLWNNKRKNQKA